MLADDDGRIRYDIMRDPNLKVSSLQLKERILAPGMQVVAIGRYSAARNALVPDETAMLHSVKISKGDPSSVASRGFGKNVLELFLGCGCLLPVIAGAILGLALMPLDAIEQQFAAKDPSWQELKIERWVEREVRPRLGSMIGQGEPVIEVDSGKARGKLFLNGKTHRLTEASARRGPGGAIRVTITGDDSRTGVMARVRDGKLESLNVLDGPAFDLTGAELETFAAGDEACNGRITALSPGDGPKVHVMFSAPIESPP